MRMRTACCVNNPPGTSNLQDQPEDSLQCYLSLSREREHSYRQLGVTATPAALLTDGVQSPMTNLEDVSYRDKFLCGTPDCAAA